MDKIVEQSERLKYLIEYLLSESGLSAQIPSDPYERKRLYRALVNVRLPAPASDGYLRTEDEYLQEELRLKGITDVSELVPVSRSPDIYVWQGDITTLKCDGIVNAANSRMLGCFAPNHYCIDNAIHTFSGVRLRQECYDLMQAQGHDEPTGRAKITAAYNLPCRYVVHTVGPIVYGELTARHEELLAECYRSCLELADNCGLQSIAFCCISTGEFRFPNKLAAKIAIETVAEYKRQTDGGIKIVFNVFKDIDHEIYTRLLGTDI